MSEYLIVAENVTFKRNKLSCINIYDNFSAVAMPAEFEFDLVIICGPNWTVGEHDLKIKVQLKEDVTVDVGELKVNIPNENFVYNAMAQNLKITLGYDIKDLTFIVLDGENQIISRKYPVNALLVPQQPQQPAENNEEAKAE